MLIPIISFSFTKISKVLTIFIFDYVHVMWRLRIMAIKTKLLYIGDLRVDMNILKYSPKYAVRGKKLNIQYTDLNPRDKQNNLGYYQMFGIIKEKGLF